MPDLRKSSPSFAGLAEIPLQRSRLLLAAASLVHLAAALPALLLSLPFPIRGTWLLAVLASWLWRLLQDPVTAIRPLPDCAAGTSTLGAASRYSGPVGAFAVPWWCRVGASMARLTAACASPCAVAPSLGLDLSA